MPTWIGGGGLRRTAAIQGHRGDCARYTSESSLWLSQGCDVTVFRQRGWGGGTRGTESPRWPCSGSRSASSQLPPTVERGQGSSPGEVQGRPEASMQCAARDLGCRPSSWCVFRAHCHECKTCPWLFGWGTPRKCPSRPPAAQRVSRAPSVSLLVFLSVLGWAERCLHFEAGRVGD